MPQIRISQVATLLGVSDDTVRRWVDQGRLSAHKDDANRLVVEGSAAATLAVELAAEVDHDALDPGSHRRSARNHLTGIVTRIVSDPVMSQVELQCGANRVVSLISTEAVNDLGLEVGSIATAVIKATNVSLEGAPA
ncbi:TOBE domain-containing protein [Aestuariimicrobium soli]|uniref:TOBE domain-containing protein n=1 Tax=Aestuariimicrobium soli TaxID=2035834 RepID=UPI003EB7928D